MKCFECGDVGHKQFSYPHKQRGAIAAAGMRPCWDKLGGEWTVGPTARSAETSTGGVGQRTSATIVTLCLGDSEDDDLLNTQCGDVYSLDKFLLFIKTKNSLLVKP